MSGETAGKQLEHVLSLSYGKDSIACLGAIEELGWPLDRIIHIEIWATETIQADPPPMVEFKAKADAIIKARWGIDVEHIRGPHTAEQRIYRHRIRGKRAGEMVGWPRAKGCEIQSSCKREPYAKAISDAITYLGIASNEQDRIERHSAREGIYLPLVKAGWTENFCRQWCMDNDLLSPIYTTATRGGCWFCPQQSIGQLRILRKAYPEYWKMMMKWDTDSPMKFKANGHTLHDYDRRFQLEDEGFLEPGDRAFKWDMIDNPLAKQLSIFDRKETTDMTAKELAATLSGREYGMEISREEAQAAKEAGLVVVYGSSDDCMELRGAIDTETGAYEGATIYVNRDGLVDDPACDDAEECTCPYFVAVRNAAKTIKAIWHDAGGPRWTFETDIPHETFTIMEDGEPFCVGIVFSTAEVTA